MALLFGTSGDHVRVAAGLGLADSHTTIFWIYPTTLTSGRRIWGLGGNDGASYEHGVMVGFASASEIAAEIVRATGSDLIETTDAGITTGKWWCVAETDSDAAGAQVYVGDLATKMRLCALDPSGTAGSGTIRGTGETGFVVGATGSATSPFQGRIAFMGRWRRAMTLGELQQQQFAPHPDADCDIFMWNGLMWSKVPDFAVDTTSESDTGTTGSASQASFSWAHLAAAADVKGVLVFTFTNANADDAISVTYGGVSMAAVSGGRAVDTAGEPGDCKAWFLSSDSIPQGTQTIVVNRNNNANVMYAAAISFVGAYPMEVVNTPTLQQTDGTLAVVAQNTGVRPAIRIAAINSGLSAVGAVAANTLAVGAGTTLAQSIDFGARVAALAYETTKGSGSRSMGWSAATSDDRAGVYLAIAEKIRDPNMAPLAAGNHGEIRGTVLAPNVPIALPLTVAEGVSGT